MHIFWEIVASNALLVIVLAVGVALLGRVWKNPAALHVLWLLVLLKLFTPPIVTIGVPLRWAAPLPEHYEEANAAVVDAAATEEPAAVQVTSATAATRRSTHPAIDATAVTLQRHSLSWSTVLAWTWAIGIGLIASVHVYRLHRFRGLLRAAHAPPAALSGMAERIARRLDLRRVPEVLMLPLRLSPLVWYVGGRPRLILPSELVDRLEAESQEAILALELAHVRRKDHLIRLFELFTATLFWWHPVVWWACRELRELEEQCCDRMALDAVRHGARRHAIALVNTLDFLADRSVAVPPGATAVKPSVSLVRRIKMLKNHDTVGRLPLGRSLLLAAVAAVPMTVALAAATPEAEEDSRPGQQESGKPGAAGASGSPAADSPEGSQNVYLAKQLSLAEQGNVWAKYKLLVAYRDGTHGVEVDLRQADRWLTEIIRGVHLVAFEPTNNFRPSTPGEFLAKFNEHSSLRSDRDGIGGASFFRTRVHDGMLIGLFLTETPDKMAADIESNPDLKLLWSAEVTPGMFVMYESSKQESLSTAASDGLAAQLREAKAGNYWAKYRLWAAYHKGTDGAKKNSEEARKWLAEVVKGAYLATFQPVNGFAPRTPREFLSKFNDHSKLRSEPRSLGGASFFRTTVKDGALIGSFLTAYPDQMRKAIDANPSLELKSIEEVTPEMFIRYEASPQESLK